MKMLSLKPDQFSLQDREMTNSMSFIKQTIKYASIQAKGAIRNY